MAAFGSLGIFGNIWIYRGYKLFFAVGTLSCILLRKAGSKKHGGERNTGLFHRRFFHINMIFCMIMPLILLIRYAYTMDFQNQGRYLLPAIIPLMYYMIHGLEKLAGCSKLPLRVAGFLGRLLPGFATLLPLLSTLSMTYLTALPIYLETGVVLQ